MNRYDALQDSRNNLEYWFSLIAEKTEVPMPKTVVYTPSEPTLEEWLDSIRQGEPIVIGWIDELIQLASEIGSRLFLRTGQGAAKFGGTKTCLVGNAERIAKQLEDILFYYAGQIGTPAPKTVVLREYMPPGRVVANGIEVVPFRAFGSQFPIGAERRYFVRSGAVECHHPYWPEDHIKEVEPGAPDWRERLEVFNCESEEEIALLAGYATEIGRVLEGSWSVDFMFTNRGWMFIDAARGECSDHLPCPYKLAG